MLPNTFFAIRVQEEGQPAYARVLEAPIQPPFLDSHGYHPVSAAGLPRLQGATLQGEYPLAKITFEDSQLPVQVELEAFTPLIPLNPAGFGFALRSSHILGNESDLSGFGFDNCRIADKPGGWDQS